MKDYFTKCLTSRYSARKSKTQLVDYLLMLTDNQLVVFLISLHCTFMLHTQQGCLSSRLLYITTRNYSITV